MYKKLSDVQLKDGERVELGWVCGPDIEWAERIESLLAHKGSLWNWQNTSVMRRELGMEAHFYLLHRNGEPLANMMTVEHRGVGHFGHVWTQPEDRRKGAASQLMAAQMCNFKERGGRALFLGTGYASAPYHIYASHGFVGFDEPSGHMAYYAAGERAFYEGYFSAGNTEVRDVQWCDWPASAALFFGDFPMAVRCVALGLLGRASTEGAFLQLLQQGEQHEQKGESSRAKVLVCADTGAVAGLAMWSWDPLWPQTCLLDGYCHPQHAAEMERLLAALVLPDAERYVAYSDAGIEHKGSALTTLGFQRTGIHARRAAVERKRRTLVDVEVWEK